MNSVLWIHMCYMNDVTTGYYECINIIWILHIQKLIMDNQYSILHKYKAIIISTSSKHIYNEEITFSNAGACFTGELIFVLQWLIFGNPLTECSLAVVVQT